MVRLSNYRAAYCTKDGTGYFSIYEKSKGEYFEVCRVYHNPGETIQALHLRAKLLVALINNKP